MTPNGWIKLHRKILNHWVFKDAERYRAWTIILMEVNHEDTKIMIHGELMDCRRGESLNSLDTWAKLFGISWDKSKVRRFFNALKTDTMIDTLTQRYTTRLRVCNYGTYQDSRHTDDTAPDTKTDTLTTPNKKVKKERSKKTTLNATIEEVVEFFTSKGSSVEEAGKFFDHFSLANWHDARGKKIKYWRQNAAGWINRNKDRQPKEPTKEERLATIMKKPKALWSDDEFMLVTKDAGTRFAKEHGLL